MKIKLIASAALVGLVVAATVLWAVFANRPRISVENYERIQEGMTQGQVEAILGGPPRWEVEPKRPRDAIIHQLTGRKWPAEWWGRNGVITVFYDSDGVVTKKAFEQLPFEAKPKGFWDYMLLRAALRHDPARLTHAERAWHLGAPQVEARG